MQKVSNSSQPVWLVFIFSLLLWFPSERAMAIVVDDLYEAEVLVADESERQLRTAARAGLLQVLVRVSGSTAVESSSLIKNALRNPAAYYYQYSYETSDTTLLIGQQEVAAKTLRLLFEPSAIAGLLRDAGYPVWGSNRPSVMLWVAVSEGQARRMLGESDTSEITAQFARRASARGVPLLLPILDLEDASRISTAEIWGAFLDRIETASRRYQPDAILTARVQEEVSGQWSARWSYRVADTWTSLETQAFSAEELVQNMVDQLADQLAARFALDSSRSRVSVTVEDVPDVKNYAALSRYLEQLTPVLASSVVALQGDVARFELETEGQLDQLIQIIELDERLLLLNRDEANSRLLYRWVN